MQDKYVFGHTNAKFHLCIVLVMNLIYNTIEHTQAKLLVNADERQVSRGDTNSEVAGH